MTDAAAAFPIGSDARRARRTIWIGRALSAIPIAMLLFSACLKIAAPPQVLQVFVDALGYPAPLVPKLAILEITCVVLYAIPRTSVMGAILMTGYLGGAITTHLRVGQPFFAQVILAVLVWGGLYLREERLRSLLPLRTALRSSF